MDEVIVHASVATSMAVAFAYYLGKNDLTIERVGIEYAVELADAEVARHFKGEQPGVELYAELRDAVIKFAGTT